MTRARVLAAVLACAGLAARADDGRTRTWTFQAWLDGKPIGEHRFTVVTEGARREVTSEADFSVKFLGFEAYRYHHRARELWQGDCLVGLVSSTDDDGKPESVRLARTGDANEIATDAGRNTVPGCLMSYAYWNPALLAQTRLLNPQTGKVDAVTVERVDDGVVAVGGKDVTATDWRISGGESPVDVWITATGAWVGLDSTVGGGRHHLRYRLPGS